GGGYDPLIDTGGDGLRVIPLHERGDTAGDLDILDAPPCLSPRLVDGLAVLHGLDTAQLLKILLEKLLEPEEHPGAGQGCRPSPLGAGLLCRLHRSVDLLSCRDGAPCNHLARRGIDHVDHLSAGSDPLSTDIVLDRLDSLYRFF